MKKVLDHGHVRLVAAMGDDTAIVQAARVSYGEGSKGEARDRKLIYHLMRNRHTTPFEMVEFKFHVKAPIFVFRQWHRHRTASINEMSARYTELPDEFYIPSVLRTQSTTNKQGSSEHGMIHAGGVIRSVCDEAHRVYRNLLTLGVAREQARMVLPVNIYSEMYWKVDLHNLLHFLRLRLDAHSQWEIRQYAEAIAGFVEGRVPVAWAAFQETLADGEED